MPKRSFKVRVFEVRDKAAKPVEVPGFTVTETNVDTARAEAASRLVGKGRVRSVNASSDDVLVAYLEPAERPILPRPSTQ